MSRPSQKKLSMSKLSCLRQTFMRSCPDFCAFTTPLCFHHTTRASISRFLCVHQTFVRVCPVFCSFGRFSCVHVQTFLRSDLDFCAFTRLSCVNVQTFVRSCPDLCAFTRLSCNHVQTFVRSCPEFCAFTRLSCVHVQTFVRSPAVCAFSRLLGRSCPVFYGFLRPFVRFSVFPCYVNLNARIPRRAFIWVWTYQLSVWNLNLGEGKHLNVICAWIGLDVTWQEASLARPIYGKRWGLEEEEEKNVMRYRSLQVRDAGSIPVLPKFGSGSVCLDQLVLISTNCNWLLVCVLIQALCAVPEENL